MSFCLHWMHACSLRRGYYVGTTLLRVYGPPLESGRERLVASGQPYACSRVWLSLMNWFGLSTSFSYVRNQRAITIRNSDCYVCD